ncbi:MAG: pyrroline-5-carboxylate reductase [Pseudomonadota bacterium]
MSDFRTAFVGAGNMAKSIVGGMLSSGFDASNLSAADPLEANRAGLEKLAVAAVTTSNRDAVQGADVIVLAVKPQVLKGVCTELRPALDETQLVLSIAAGVNEASLRTWLGEAPAIVRCMPNTPALLGSGATAVHSESPLSNEQRMRVERILGAVGLVAWVDAEDLLHGVTALSGSGPAYFFQFMEAMIEEAQRMGLTEQDARALCAQTCIGAGRMVAESATSASELRRRVTSPGGTTERAVAVFSEEGLERLVRKAMRECYARSQELAQELA